MIGDFSIFHFLPSAGEELFAIGLHHMVLYRLEKASKKVHILSEWYNFVRLPQIDQECYEPIEQGGWAHEGSLLELYQREVQPEIYSFSLTGSFR